LKKILFVIPYLHLGGAETQFRNLINGLAQDDQFKIDVFVLSQISFENKSKLHDHVNLKSIGLNFNKSYSNRYIRNFWYIINYLWVSLYLICNFFRVKRYDTIISYRLLMAPLIPVFKICSKKVVFSERTASQEILNKKWMAFLFNYSNYITCNSLVTKDYLELIGVRDVKVIFNGINYKKILPVKNNIVFKRAAVIARIHPLKNQLIVLKALKKIEGIIISFVGEITDKQYMTTLEQYIKFNNLSDKVEFINFTDDILEHYQKADFVILPSLEEGMSNVILESLLHHRFIISSNIPANKIINKNRGGVFEVLDENSLIFEINKLKKINKSDYINLLEQNSIFIKNQFSLDSMVNNYKKLI